MKIVKLTPTLAQRWLEESMPNRPLNQPTIRSYARDMENGNWTIPTMILFDNETKRMFDGGHRCAAVVQSGVTIDVIQQFASYAMFSVIDQGRKRTLKETLQLKGYSYTTELASGIQKSIQFENVWSNGTYSRTHENAAPFSMTDKLEVLSRHPDLAKNAKWAKNRNSASSAPINTGIILALRSVAEAAGAGGSMMELVDQVAFGEGLGSGMPAFTLRTRLLRAKSASHKWSLRPDTLLAFWVATYNAYLEDRELHVLKRIRGAKLATMWPMPIGIDDWMDQATLR